MNKSPKKRENNSFEILVSVSLLIVFILVIITGILSHQRLNQIILSVKEGIRPDRRLILVKEINNNLTEAENSVKSFSLTRSADYLERFYELTDSTGKQFEELDEMVSPEDPLSPDIDTLSRLVDDKFTILDRLLSIQDEFRVQQAMEKVVKSIEEQEIQDTAVVSPSSPVITDTVKSAEPVKKENIISRLFKKKKKPVNQSIDTSIPAEAPDTIQSADENPAGTPEEKISEKVEKVQEEVLTRDRKLRKEEWKLLQEDKEVMARIRRLISGMEEKEKNHRLLITKEAELKAGEIKFIIMAFGIAAAGFILLAALVVYKYVRKNNEYKAVLEQARKDAEELAKAKEMFLANMSHEIRTPMNIISGFLSQVLKGPLDEGQHEKLLVIKKSSDHLLQLLNDLLDLSKLQADKLELLETNFSAADVVREIHQLFEPAAKAKDLQFIAIADPRLPVQVFGDPLRLRQILFNLLSNAIKFTESGSVSIRSFALSIEPVKVVLVFEITDTGIGMNETELEKIFTTFEKANSRPGSNVDGAGLGLAITRKLVSRQGGTIRVESKPGAGSNFRVEIPYKIAQDTINPEPGKALVNTHNLNGRHILVVDDDEYNRQLARIILEKYGCRISESGSAEESLEIVEPAGIELVLMDIHLPGMNGPEAALRIKQIGARSGKNIPVIAVSATISKGDLEKFKLNGMDDFILKPYQEETLLEMIGRFTKNSSNLDKDGQTSVNPVNDLHLKDLKGSGPVYDLGPLKTSSGGNDVFVREMINLFIDETDVGLTTLLHYLELNQWQPASELAHKMISPCRHLKADMLASMLKEIENIREKHELVTPAIEIARQARIEFERIREDIIRKQEL